MGKPIIFSSEMVKAILDGRKSVTRRVVKPPAKPPYEPGNVLWVRETWARISDVAEVDPEVGLPDGYIYKADWWGNSDESNCPKWHPSIYMPREAARIFLHVKSVRIERLQDITPHDAWEEGCRIGNSFLWEDHIPELQQQCRDVMFKGLWDSINAKRGYSWDTNPTVWVISFKADFQNDGFSLAARSVAD